MTNRTSGMMRMPLGEIAPDPSGLPTELIADSFATAAFAQDFTTRRAAFVDFTLRNPPGNTPYSLIRLSTGQLPHEAGIVQDLDFIEARNDTADFRLASVLRLLYQFGDSLLLSEAVVGCAREVVLGFKYWPDEPGIDGMSSQTENHFVLFASAAYLSAQLYPEALFVNSQTLGADRIELFRDRLLRWLRLRFQTGFSEWLSNVYYSADAVALLNLVDFAADSEVASLATQVLDLLLSDVAHHLFQGSFASSHGRARKDDKFRAHNEQTGSFCKLLFGVNRFLPANRSTTHFALSSYRMPQVLFDIAAVADAVTITKQRMGIRVEEGARWGLSYRRFEDGMMWTTLEAYAHPLTIELSYRMLNEHNWWANPQFARFGEMRGLIDAVAAVDALPLVAALFERDITRHMRPEVNLYSYETPDYMLSTAQDWRAGYGGDQQAISQATLSPEAIVFTTHPANTDTSNAGPTPSYWTGYGTMPKAVQVENVAIELYTIDTRPGLYLTNELRFTHAFFPSGRFDEVIERDHWIFGRVGKGYIGLWSHKTPAFKANIDDAEFGGPYEIVAEGVKNIWIKELGREADFGSFGNFMKRVLDAPIFTTCQLVSYRSPSQGLLTVGRYAQLRKGLRLVKIADYPRYDSAYAKVAFPGRKMRFQLGTEWLELDLETGSRELSAGVE